MSQFEYLCFTHFEHHFHSFNLFFIKATATFWLHCKICIKYHITNHHKTNKYLCALFHPKNEVTITISYTHLDYILLNISILITVPPRHYQTKKCYYFSIHIIYKKGSLWSDKIIHRSHFPICAHKDKDSTHTHDRSYCSAQFDIYASFNIAPVVLFPTENSCVSSRASKLNERNNCLSVLIILL